MKSAFALALLLSSVPILRAAEDRDTPSKTVAHYPGYLLLNLAIGAEGGDPSKTKFLSRYEVDYVHAYQKSGDK